MKSFLSLAGLSLAVAFVTFAVVADDKAKDVTLKGSIMCAKCALGETTECTTAIQVKEGDKLVIEAAAKHKSLAESLAELEPIDEEFPEIDDPPPEPVEL